MKDTMNELKYFITRSSKRYPGKVCQLSYCLTPQLSHILTAIINPRNAHQYGSITNILHEL